VPIRLGESFLTNCGNYHLRYSVLAEASKQQLLPVVQRSVKFVNFIQGLPGTEPHRDRELSAAEAMETKLGQ